MGLEVANLTAKLGLDFSGLETGLRTSLGKLEDFSRSVEGVGKTLTASLTVPIAAAAAAMTEAGATFEDALYKIRRATGETGESLGGLEEDFKKVFEKVPASAGQVSSAISDLHVRLGLVGEPLRDMATQFLTLARVTGSDVNPLIRDATRVFIDWHVATQDQVSLLDYFLRVSQKTGVGVGQLVGEVGHAGPALRQLGFSVQETAAMFGLFEKNGINAQAVAMGLQRGLANLAKSGEEPRVAFNRLVSEIKNATTAQEAIMVATAIFGTRIAVQLVNAIRSGNFEFKKFADSVRDGGDTVENAGKSTLGLSDMMVLLKNRVATVLQPIGTELVEVMKKLVSHMSDTKGVLAEVVKWFMSLPESVRMTTYALAGLAAVIGPLAVGAGAMLPLLATGFATLASGIGLVIAHPVIAGLVALGVALGVLLPLMTRGAAGPQQSMTNLWKMMSTVGPTAQNTADALAALNQQPEAAAAGEPVSTARILTKPQLAALEAINEELRNAPLVPMDTFEQELRKMTKAFDEADPSIQAVANRLALLVIGIQDAAKAEEANVKEIQQGTEKYESMAPIVDDATIAMARHAQAIAEKVRPEYDALFGEVESTAPSAFGTMIESVGKLNDELRIQVASLGGSTTATLLEVEALRNFKKGYDELGPAEQEQVQKLVSIQQRLDAVKTAQEFVKAGYTATSAVAMASILQQDEAEKSFFGAFQAGALDFLAKGSSMWTSMRDMTSEALGFMSKTLSDVFFEKFTGQTVTAAEVWKSFMNSMLRTVSDFLAQQVVKTFLNMFFGGTTQGFGGGLGSAAASFAGGVVGSAAGGAGGGFTDTQLAQMGAAAGWSQSQIQAAQAANAVQAAPGLAPGVQTLLGSASLANAFPGFANIGSNFAAGGIQGALFGMPAIVDPMALEAGLSTAQATITPATVGPLGSAGSLSAAAPWLAGAGIALNLATAFSNLGSPASTGTLAGTAVGAGAGALIGSIVPGVGTLAGALLGGALGGSGGGLLGGLFGGAPKLTHEQRENIDLQNVLAAAGGFQGELSRAKSPADMWKTIVKWQSGSVGGTSSPAIFVGLANTTQADVTSGDVVLPGGAKDLTRWMAGPTGSQFPPGAGWWGSGPPVVTGNLGTNPSLPMVTEKGFFNILKAHPEALVLGIQAGIEQGKLSGANANVAAFIKQEVQNFGFEHGGSFVVEGSGGADSQLVSFMATPGETVDVTPATGGAGSAAAPVHITVQLDGRTLFESWVGQARNAARAGRKFLPSESVVVKTR